jgi:hypothetical protein
MAIRGKSGIETPFAAAVTTLLYSPLIDSLSIKMISEFSLLICHGYVRNLQNYLYDSCSFLRQFIAPVNAVRKKIPHHLFVCV